MNSLASAPFQQVFRNRAIAKATIAKELGISAKSKVNKNANEDYIRFAFLLHEKQRVLNETNLKKTLHKRLL